MLEFLFSQKRFQSTYNVENDIYDAAEDVVAACDAAADDDDETMTTMMRVIDDERLPT